MRDGFFPGRDDAAVARAIAQSGARVALVALGSPRQEQFIAEALGPAGIPVGIGLGGSFDVLAGNVPRAPALVRRLGLEWLFRLLREPWRWRRQLALPQFALLALRERLSDRR